MSSKVKVTSAKLPSRMPKKARAKSSSERLPLDLSRIKVSASSQIRTASS
jgi:hypothetical protein